ncbi:phospholipase-like protein [Artemisia annua]|uniref:Phospholipase-like protein n=1 Tax=Artemisia annua TaxID=35608 RepID=A0A2U1KN31_ARTAN|nr:phospholipase-like protein [Artemisia annua]
MFDAKITVRSRLDNLTNIRALLNVKRSNLFRTTVFGQWLDIPPYSPDNHLYDYFYQNAVSVPEIIDSCPPLRFKIGDNVLDFGREQFCLVTGFRLGQVAKEETDIGRIVRGIPYSPFLDRLFPKLKSTNKKRIKGQELLTLMNSGPVWDSLLDVDAVRVCLLVIATCVFIGREPRFYIPDHMLKMIEDLSVWNEYPWGEYMWAHLYKRTVNVVLRHTTNKDSKKPVKKSLKKIPKRKISEKRRNIQSIWICMGTEG